jgi:predicted amidohydrolase
MGNMKRISVICSRTTDSKGFKSLSRLNALNRDFWKSKIENVIDSVPDIIVLPEYCDRFSDFSTAQYIDYIENNGSIAELISDIARKHKTQITYPGLRKHESDTQYPYRNSIRMFDVTGEIAHIYDKNHVIIEENQSGIGYGTDASIYKTKDTKIVFGICFDLNFDSLLEKYKAYEPDLFIFSSYYHGGLKQDQWAYALRCHMASAISGNTGRIINPFGQVIASTTNYYDYVTAAVNLDCKVVHLDYNMEKIRQAKKKYKKHLTVHDPGNVATVLLTCESENMNICDILKEFEIETYDQYLRRSIEYRNNHISR